MSQQRKASESSETRLALIDATEQLMEEFGCAAVSSRRIGERAGVAAPLIHYYFETMDDLYLAVFRRAADHNLERLREASKSEQPLRSLWEVCGDRSAKLATEFMALAHRRPAIRAEVIAYSDRTHQLQIEAIARHFVVSGKVPDIPLPVAALLLSSVAHMLSLQSAQGVSCGHSETNAYIEALLDKFDGVGMEPSRTKPMQAVRG